MYIISIIPLTKIPLPAPQTLDYFSASRVSAGGIVRIKIGRRSLLGVAISCVSIKERKQQIKRMPFQLKPVDEIINENAIIPKHHIKLAFWTSSYFYSSLGLIMKSLLPRNYARPTKKFLKEISLMPPVCESAKSHSRSAEKPILYWSKHNESAKTSYYEKEAKTSLNKNKIVLFLVPELYKISFFKKKIPLLSDKNCVIGTRSILSMPRQNLGLIIVDEEESPFYKSFDREPRINARDVAIKLAELAGAKIILGSNLPSIESFWKAKTGKYLLKQQGAPEQKARVTDKKHPLPSIKIVDMKQELRGGNYSIFSRELQKNLREITKNNGRAILFINRKGLSTGLLCRECGHIIKCPNCDVPMVYHATNHQLPTTNYQLICHHCGQKQNPPAICPGCEGHKIKFIGTGTQKVEDELIRLSIVPTEMIVRMDLDVAPRLEQQQKIFSEFRSKKYQILIGTQLMLRDVLLPRVKIAAIMTIDPLLSLPDFRMNEQIMRIIDKLQAICSGKLILQTYSIDNFIIKNFLENLSETKRLSPLVFNKLFISEIQNRKELSLPPFSQIIKLTYSHKNQERAEQEAKTLKSKLLTQGKSYKLKAASYQVLGPAPAFIPRIKNRYVWQIMIKSKIDDLSLRNKLLRVAPSDWKTDVDPAGMI